jgi:lipoprotein-anchoring transpeptidase ErfK/SrfK
MRREGHKRAFPVICVALLAGVALAACTTKPHVQGLPENKPAAPAAPTTPLTLAVTPANGGNGVPVSSEIGIAVGGGHLTDVSLVKAGTSDKILGMLRDDGSSWIPAKPLAWASTYTATVSAASPDGKQTQTQTTTFTTMGKPGPETGTGLYLFDGETVGVAMPIVIEFDTEVPEAARAEVQKRLFVATNPPQVGVWHWASGRQVWYRGPDYWKPGTTIAVRAALQGVPMGNGTYGDTDRTATATVGNKVFMNVDNASKSMQVYVDNQLVRTMPVSLGKPSTPSSSGAMVLMSKSPTYRFDTRAELGAAGYVVDVNWAMRLTWGGEFIHAAPWSVGDQGVRNVSHGCVNMSDGNSQWLYDQAHVGDPIIVRGTEVPLVDGNGWTAWNQTWADYVKGSALPVPASVAALPGIDPVTGQLPTPPPAAPASPAPAAAPAPSVAPTR